MHLSCRSYSGDGQQFLGIVKRRDAVYSIALYDKRSPFRDVLGAWKYCEFSSSETAWKFIEQFLGEMTKISLMNISPIKEGEWMRCLSLLEMPSIIVASWGLIHPYGAKIFRPSNTSNSPISLFLVLSAS